MNASGQSGTTQIGFGGARARLATSAGGAAGVTQIGFGGSAGKSESGQSGEMRPPPPRKSVSPAKESPPRGRVRFDMSAPTTTSNQSTAMEEEITDPNICLAYEAMDLKLGM